MSRGDDNSDVDLFFDHQKGKLGLYELMDLKEVASSILGSRADIIDVARAFIQSCAGASSRRPVLVF